MKDIKCPSCGKTFQIDPSSFNEILLQIKDEEFNKQIEQRLFLAKEDNDKAKEILKQENPMVEARSSVKMDHLFIQVDS